MRPSPFLPGGIVKILITGGAGFIGSHVVRYCVEAGHEVLVADRFTYAGKARNLAPVLKDIQVLIGDLATGDLAARCAEVQPDWVIHLAAETHVDHAIAEPARFMWSNVMGTTWLLQALYEQEGPYPGKILVYSTDEVFGPTPAGQWFTESAPLKPSNTYSASKVGVEGIATAFHVTHGLPSVLVRPCNTYRPGQHPEKAIPRFVGQVLRGEPLTLYNDGQGSRDWLYVTDHARAIEWLLHYAIPGAACNLAAGEEHTDEEVAHRIVEILGADTHPITYQPGRPGHDRRYAMDGARLRALGWQPLRPFAEAFRETVLWYAQHQDHWSHDLVEVA
jgi:dTDP-glucose 4,6-dehydratase